MSNKRFPTIMRDRIILCGGSEMELTEKKEDCKIYDYKKDFLRVLVFFQQMMVSNIVFRFHGIHLKE